MDHNNQQILNFLSYYLLEDRSPRYAVLLGGPWGAGKTKLVDDALRAYKAASLPGVRICYVSLFGISSAEDFNLAVVTAIHPIAFSKGGRLFGAAVRAGLGKYGIGAGIKIEDYVNINVADVYVFDDLERCELEATRVLGLINSFVEHDGSKVIIVGNEAEIDSSENYKRRREKVVGQTFVVRPAVADALTGFLGEMQNSAAKDFIEVRGEQVRRIFGEAGHGNLRVLRRTIAEYGRFWGALETRHIEKADAMEAAMRLFFALSLELRSGQISVEDLGQRQRRRYGQSKDADQKSAKMAAAKERHATDLADEILSGPLLQTHARREPI